MFKVSIQPQWQLEQPDGKQSLPRLVELLARVRETGTLAEACVQAGLSYRYAWGLLQDGTRTFGAPLVTMMARPASDRRSRGSSVRIRRKLALRLVSTTPSQSSVLMWARGESGPSTAALATRISRRLKRS